MAQKSFKAQLTYLLASIFVLLVVGCSGGGSEGPDEIDTETGTGTEVPPPIAENFIEIEARLGPIVAVRVGELAQLDGSGSITSSLEALTYSWSFTSKPDTSNAQLLNETTDSPSFTPDVKGVYMAQLVVSAEGLSSQRAIASIIATVLPERLTGRFNHQGLSSNCVNCHNDDFLSIPGKSLNHVATTNTCQTCHTPQGFDIIPFVDHQEVFGNCSECHNGVLAVGKSEFHLPTQAECDDCHNTRSFLELEPDGSFDHSSINRACTGCHNGTVAIGKNEGHVVTDSECGFCHTTVSFQDAYPDHSGPDVMGPNITCDSCHNGTLAQGASIGHPLTNVDCAVCHNVVSFSMGGVFNHRLVDSSIQPCESCHNDNNSINAPGKSSAVPAHPVVTGDCGLCHSTETFTGAFVDHGGPDVVGKRCDSCHGVDATGKSVNHMPTTEDCNACHTPGTFTTGSFDHVGVVDNCESCHDNVITVGKLVDHLPTTADCVVCHNTSNFTDTTFDHLGIDTTDCSSCHNGEISTGKHLAHLPTVLDCSSCHDINNFDSFAGITFNHLGIDSNNCSSCHDTGIATGKTVSHIPTQQDCSVCHDSTDVFTTNTFLSTLHQDISRGCEGCHVTRILPAHPDLVKAIDHLPTSQDCYVCHSNTTFNPSIFDHVGINSNCSSCHNGDFVALNALAAPNTTIHQTTTEDCGTCHNTVNFADAFVDHSGPEVVGKRCDSCHDGGTGGAIGKNDGHVVTTQDCNVCHVPGSFTPAEFNHTGIVDNCASCHDGVEATGKNSAHLPTTEDCSVCHNTTAFSGAKFDHQGIVDNCSSCHNGNTATGKHNNHVPTNADCVDCHVTTGFIPSTFDHVGIVDNCSSCHNGQLATGKTSNHVDTNQDCGVCHSTRTFIPATFEHTGIVDNCVSCHDGNIATGKHSTHIPTVLDCHLCHTTATFIGGTWAHDASSVGNCDQCHSSGGGATFKPNDHLSTNEQCDVCHTTDSWAPTDFNHSPQGNYPGDHRRDPGCKGCHTGSIGAGINSDNYPNQLRYAPFCAGCHAGDFESEGDHIGGRSGTIEQNKNCGGSGCHKVSDRDFD